MSIELFVNSIDKTSMLKVGSLNITRNKDHKNNSSFVLIGDGTFVPEVGHSLYVYDTNILKFCGVIDSIKIKRIGVVTSNKVEITCGSNGFHRIPSRRTVSDTWTNTTCGAIVNSYITSVLSGDGISVGSVSVGSNIATYDARCKSISTILDDLAGASGFNWWIDYDLKLYFKLDTDMTTAPHEIEESGVFTDFRDVEIEKTLDGYHNKVFVKGGTDTNGNTVIASVQNNIEISAQQAIEGGSGVYGIVQESSTIKNNTDAVAVANELLSKYSIQAKVLKFDTYANDFDIRQKVYVNLPSLGINTTYYIIDSVNINNNFDKKLLYKVTMHQLTNDNKAKPIKKYSHYFSKLVNKANSVPRTASDVGAIEDVANAIHMSHIADAAITTAKLANLAVDVTKLADLAITASKLADGSITTPKLGDASVDGAKIKALAITGTHITNLAVTNAHIANLAVDNAKIANAAIDSVKIADAAITSAKIANLAVGSAAIASAAIGTAHIANGVILNAHIQDATITSAKIGSIDAGKINVGTLTGMTIQTSAVSTDRLALDSTNGLVKYDNNNYKRLQIDTAGASGGRIQFMRDTEIRGEILEGAGNFVIRPVIGLMVLGAPSKTTELYGDWNMSNATVSGFTVKFA